MLCADNPNKRGVLLESHHKTKKINEYTSSNLPENQSRDHDEPSRTSTEPDTKTDASRASK